MDLASLLLKMDTLHASDLFLSVGRRPGMRSHGEVVPIPDCLPTTQEDFQSFFRDCLPADISKRMEAEKDLDMGVSLGAGRRFRLNLSYQRGNLSMAVRRIPSGALDATALRIPENVLNLAELNRGLVLITGATGSGKTTTMACMLNRINTTMRKHVVTIEDPIEFSHEDQMAIISQREIGSDTQDFATALRHVVRQNPDIIFIGEMRDQETIRTAISAAMTGHLVMATMHTIDVQQTIERIISYFPEGMRDQVAMDLSLVIGGIIAQRLVPRKAGDGRVPAFEVLKSTPLVSRLIRTRDLEPLPEILKGGVQEGMIDFNHSLHALVKEGLVELDVAASCATGKDAFMLLAQGMETGIDTLRQYSGDPDHGLSIKRLLREAISRHSSDLILTVDSPPVIRVDGTLRPLDMPVLGSADTQKLLFSVLTPSQRLDFETNHEVDFALSVRGLDAPEGTPEAAQPQRHADFRFRVNGFYQKGSVACAMRVIPNVIPTPEAIGLPPAVVNLCTRQQGLVLVTGPTGSGKSTTLASMLNVLNQNRPCHIITIEDPIEFVHSHKAAIVEQREIHADTFSFANALKYVLRQDPDVILVGEMRDPETIATVLTAAETGHLVFATLHTNDVTQSVDRIIDVFPSERQNQIRSQLAACLEAIISQRLLPRKGGMGRVAIFEVLMGTLAVRALIRDKKTHQLLSVMETSMKEGMVTMERALRNACEAGVISQATMLSAMPSNSKSSITGITYR